MSASDEALILARIRKYILVAQENYKNDKIMAANQILIDIDNIISASSDSIKLVIIKELDNEPFTKEIRAVGGKVQNLFTLMTGYKE